jgi:hypothetical protein
MWEGYPRAQNANLKNCEGPKETRLARGIRSLGVVLQIRAKRGQIPFLSALSPPATFQHK